MKANKKNMQSSKLQINLKNLDDITQNTLNFFFSSNLCSYAEINLFDKEADLLVVDFDRGIDDSFIKELEANNQIALVLHLKSDIPVKDKRLLWLKKPIQVMELKEKIKKAYQLHTNGFDDAQINNTKQQTQNKTDDKLNDDFCLVDLENQIEEKKQDLNSPKQIKEKQASIDFKQPPKLKPKEIIRKRVKHKNAHLFHAISEEESAKEIQNRYRAHKHVGSNRDVDLSQPQNVEKIYFEPQKYLYYHLVKAVKMAQNIGGDVIIKTVFGNIYYHLKKDEFIHDFDETKLRFMRSNTVFRKTKLLQLEKKSQIILHHPIVVAKEKMIWQSAILASRGNLPQGTDVHKDVILKCWPNYSKLQLFRYIIQITAAWSRHRISLADTAAKLKIPQRYVFTLYTAMHALECANISDDKSNFAGFKKEKSKSLFSKILSHIFQK